MSNQIDLQQEIQNNIKQLQILQNKAHKFTRAHQILPRHRRRRCMSWNFNRLPQSLRPRALKESGSNKLIFDLNKPLKSRKSIRCACNDKKQRYISKKCIVNKLYVNDNDTQIYCCKYVERSQTKIIRYSLRLPIQNLPFFDRSTNLYTTFTYDQFNTQFNQIINQVGQYQYQYQNITFELYPQFKLGIVYSFNYNSIKKLFNNIQISNFISFLVFGDIQQCLKERHFQIQQQDNILTIDINQFKHLKRLQTQQTRQQQVFQMLQVDYIQNNHFDQSLLNKVVRLLKNEQQSKNFGQQENKFNNSSNQINIQLNGNNLYVLKLNFNISICFASQSYRNENLYYAYKHFIPIGLQERRYHFYLNDIKDMSMTLSIQLNNQMHNLNSTRKQWNQSKKIIYSKQFKQWLLSDKLSIKDINFDNLQEQQQNKQYKLIKFQEIIYNKYQNQLQNKQKVNLTYPLYINTLGQQKGLSKQKLDQDQIKNQIVLL